MPRHGDRPTPAFQAALDLVASLDGRDEPLSPPGRPGAEMIAGADAPGLEPLVALRIYRAMLREP